MQDDRACRIDDVLSRSKIELNRFNHKTHGKLLQKSEEIVDVKIVIVSTLNKRILEQRVEEARGHYMT